MPKLHRHIVFAALLSCFTLGAAPTTQQAPADPMTAVAQHIAEKAAGRSVVLVIRPDAANLSQNAQIPSSIAAVRETILSAMKDARVEISISEQADALLRDSATGGVPTVATMTPVLPVAKTDLVLYAAVSHPGSRQKISFNLFDVHASLFQSSVLINSKESPATEADIDLAMESINQDMKPAISSVIESIQSAGIKTILLTIHPESSSDSATAGFEMQLYDAVSKPLHHDHVEVTMLRKPIAGALKPATVAALKDLPESSAVAMVTYTRKPGGMLVRISVVSTTAEIAKSTAGLNSWDVAAMPAYPVMNMRVLAYSEAQQGKKVGNGECWTLAADALVDAKAHHAEGYTFGRKLLEGETIYPGDIMQFTSVKLEGKTAHGSWSVTLGMPHHTAVVRRVLGPTKYEILEQNPGPVKAATIDFKDLKSGTWEAYRPVPK